MRQFVVQPADKETGALTFTCRKHWEDMLLREVRETPTYAFAGGGAQSHVQRSQASPETAEVRAGRLAAARAKAVAHLPSDSTTLPPRVNMAMEVSQADRVLRAQHDFGVLAIGVTQIVPSDAHIRERATAVRDAVAAERAAGAASEAVRERQRLAMRQVQLSLRSLADRCERMRQWTALSGCVSGQLYPEDDQVCN